MPEKTSPRCNNPLPHAPHDWLDLNGYEWECSGRPLQKEADNTQPQTWHKVTLLPKYPHLDAEQVYICDCGETEPVVRPAGTWEGELGVHNGRYAVDEDDYIDAIIADHAAATKLAERDAEIESLRNERTSLIAEMNQHAVDARNDRQRLYEKVWAEEARTRERDAEADALAQALEQKLSHCNFCPLETALVAAWYGRTSNNVWAYACDDHKAELDGSVYPHEEEAVASLTAYRERKAREAQR